MADTVRGVLLYCLICTSSLLAGRGILLLLRVEIDKRVRVWASPPVTLVAWSLLLGTGISVGLPVKYLWLIGWIATTALALYAILRGGLKQLKGESGSAALMLVLPMTIMAPFFLRGITTYLGSPFPDGWSYVAFGRYLWEYPRGSEGGLAPLYQYAAHLSHTRFVSAALLGFLSPITGSPGDTQASSGYLLAWTLFVFASSCLFVATAKGIQGRNRMVYAAVCIFAGWLLNMLWANNFDNALAISFLPACLGLITIAQPGKWGWAIIFGGTIAGAFYSYPEGAVFLLGGIFLFLLHRLISRKEALRAWVSTVAIAGCVALLLLLPYLPDLVQFIRNQLNAASLAPGTRPGEGLFTELLLGRPRIAAIWGLGRDAIVVPGNGLVERGWAYGRYLLSGLFYLLTIFGLVQLIRRKDWGLVALMLGLFLGSLLMIFVARYGYGAYKLLLLDWWAISFALVTGGQWLVDRMHEVGWHRVARVSIGIACGLVLLVNGYRVYAFDAILHERSILPYKALEGAAQIIGNQGALVSIDNATANEWAVYFLRDTSIYLSKYRSYMAQPHVVPLMNRAASPELSEVRLALTDALGDPPVKGAEDLWTSGAYRLWALPVGPWILIAAINNPNGIENWAGTTGFWVGNRDTEIQLVSSSAGEASLEGVVTRGPSLPGAPDRHLVLATDQGTQALDIAGDGVLALRFHVAKGRNWITLRALDLPTVSVMPNGDTRPLIVGVRGLSIEFSHD